MVEAVPTRSVTIDAPPSSPRAPLGVLTNAQPKTPGSAFGKGGTTPKLLSRTPLVFSRPARLDENVAALSRPRAPSTPGGLSDLSPPSSSTSGLDISDDVDEPADLLGALGPARGSKAASSARPCLYVPESDRYSLGGTAIGGYEGFGASGMRRSTSLSAMMPPSTRLLVLEERVKELEAQKRTLQDENSQLRQVQPPAPARTVEAETQAGDGTHPCFGRLVADMGCKKVYVASARTFVNTVPIWAKQRACNEGRVDEIVKLKSHSPELMGPIMCFEFQSKDDVPGGLALPSVTCPQPRAIFDGQHRARAAMRLLSSDAFDIDDGEEAAAIDPPTYARALTRRRQSRPPSMGRGPPPPAGAHADFALLIEVYPVSHESDVKRLYLEVNKGETVKEIDLPDQLAPSLKAHIDGACEKLMKAYPEMHKPSEKCRPPHLHKDTLRNKLFTTACVHHVRSSEELYVMIMHANDKLKAKPPSAWGERVRGKPLQKAKQHGLFLGLSEFGWLETLGEGPIVTVE